MKTNYLKTVLVAFALSGGIFTSCSESFLDIESLTESSTGNFYKTESDAYRALLGCYDGWQVTSSNTSVGFYLASQVMADECFGATGYTDGRNYQAIDRFDIAQSSSDLNIYEQDWINYYAAVYRCNQLIVSEEQIAWNGDVTKGTYMGECRALRALLYFDMVRLWGNIPLLTAPNSGNIEQANPDEVYEVIIGDLKYAAQNIPASAYPKSNAAQNDGRITPFAAKALLARVYLFYTGYYGKEPAGVTKSEVLQGLEEFIAAAPAEGYGLIEEYKNLWRAASTSWQSDGQGGYRLVETYAGDGHAETVLAQKFNYTQNYNGDVDGNRWLVMMGVRNTSSAPYG
ncbi:MAG: RagB/SusD family nutrient uptake outer membrane protein, partial [Phocaeicola sp.]